MSAVSFCKVRINRNSSPETPFMLACRDCDDLGDKGAGTSTVGYCQGTELKFNRTTTATGGHAYRR